ncbi:MAG: ABC transporter ATP-binding protein [Thermoplasmatales archaeon]|nr:ABC transporter ATP-binding protein [Thermoplasmatales archaeon]
MEGIIVADGIVKRFGDLVAVDNVSLSIKKGEIFGFLGPNGAGKTTTIRMLTTMSRPDSGTVRISGKDVYGDYRSARQSIGVIQQLNSLEKDITVRENIKHHALMKGIPSKEIKGRTEEMTEVMGLGDHLDKLVRNLSGGWKKRASIVCSIIHRPRILFMDEPTAGLDTQSRNALWKLIRKLNASGTTIFMTTHYISEAEALCDRVGIVNKGKLVALGTKEDLKKTVGRFAVESVDAAGDTEVRYFENRTDAKGYSDGIDDGRSVTIRAVSLEDVFLELTGRRI